MRLIGETNKIETSVSIFGKLVRERCLLVDKSLMIKEFLEGKTVSVIVRPRRFGKTLNLSMLQHFFAAEVDGIPTQGLFDQFQIAQVDGGQFLQQHQGKYPVIFLTLKDVKEDSFDNSTAKIKILIQKLYRDHERSLTSDSLTTSDKTNFKKYLDGEMSDMQLEESLSFLSEFLHKAHGEAAIILIDEYDTPLTQSYEHGFLDELSDFMRNMFSAALKDNSHLHKGLMTGILRVSKNNLLSGLNNPSVFTVLDRKYEQYFGFTETEVEALVTATQVKQSLDEIRRFYNGYKVAGMVVYNPWSVMNFLCQNELAPYWVLTSNDRLLKQLFLKCDEETKVKLRDLMQARTIESQIDVDLRYEDLMERSDTLWTLLLFGGYLTVESSQLSSMDTSRICQLRIPNQEVTRQYYQIFNDWIRRTSPATYDSFLKSLVEGHVEVFTKRLTGYLLSCTSSHDFQLESDYHNFVHGLLATITQTHYIESNKEYGAGRPDSLLIPKDPTKTQGIILEFKHAALNKSARTNIEKLRETTHDSAKEAVEQINMRGYSYAFWKHPHITSVLKIGIAFSNRLVSSAYIIATIHEGEEVKEAMQEASIEFIDSERDMDTPTLDPVEKKSGSKRKRVEEQEEKDLEESPSTLATAKTVPSEKKRKLAQTPSPSLKGYEHHGTFKVGGLVEEELTEGGEVHGFQKASSLKGFAHENGYELRTTDGDGNCFFSAIAILLNRQNKTHLTHADVRREGINYIKTHSERFTHVFGEEFDYGTQEKYLQSIVKDNAWALGPIIDATALHYGFRLTIIDFRENEDLHFVRLNEEDEELPLFTLCRTGEDLKCQHYDALLATSDKSFQNKR